MTWCLIKQEYTSSWSGAYLSRGYFLMAWHLIKQTRHLTDMALN